MIYTLQAKWKSNCYFDSFQPKIVNEFFQIQEIEDSLFYNELNSLKKNKQQNSSLFVLFFHIDFSTMVINCRITAGNHWAIASS